MSETPSKAVLRLQSSIKQLQILKGSATVGELAQSFALDIETHELALAEITTLRAQLDEARAAFTQIREHTKDVVDDDLIAVVDMIAEDFLDPSKRAPLRALLSESKT